MIAIAKGREPAELTEYRSQPGAVYDGPEFTPVKDRIREALLEEQGYLCAYCMQRIELHSMKVEHWHSRAKYPKEELVYQNMLGCCSGNEGRPREEQHCDTHKAKSDITCNPADCEHHQRLQIRFSGDGTIHSDDPRFDTDMDRILNLNWVRLKNNRKAVWDAVLQELSKRPGSRTESDIQRLIRRWKSKDARGCLEGYFAVAIYLLEKKLRKIS